MNHNAKVLLFPNTYHARSRRGAHFGRMHGRRVQLKEVHTKSYADGQKLLCIYSRLKENLLHRAGMDIDTLGKPLVGVALSAKFLSYELSYRYLHNKNRESFLSALEVLDYLYSKQRSSRFLRERSASMLEYSKKRNCPDSECYYESKKRLIMSLSYYSILLYLFRPYLFVLISYCLLSATNIHILFECAKPLLLFFKNHATLPAIPNGCDIDHVIFNKVIDPIV